MKSKKAGEIMITIGCIILFVLMFSCFFYSVHNLYEANVKACQNIGYDDSGSYSDSGLFSVARSTYCSDKEGNLHTVRIDCTQGFLGLTAECTAKNIKIDSYNP